MQYAFTVTNILLKFLAKKRGDINIILGTSSIARDMQTKLRLIGLNAPYLVGDRDDEATGIRHYKHLAEIDDPARYRFISCWDTDEQVLIGSAQSEIVKLLGTVRPSHPQFLQLTNIAVMSDSLERVNDIFSMSSGLLRSHPYVCYGNNEGDDSDAFNIQVWGSSSCRSIGPYSQYLWPELLYGHLDEVGFKTTVCSWGQSVNSFADCVLRFLRDGYARKPDLVIFYTSATDMEALRYKDKNILSTRIHEEVNPLLDFMRSDNMCAILGDISDGIDHDADPVSIWVQRHRVMCALSRLFNFEFWNCLLPNPLTLPKEQAEKISGMSPGYLARRRKIRDDAVIDARRHGKIIDFSDAFTGSDNIFSFYLDGRHLTNEGNELIARRFASEILAKFDKRII